MSLSAGKPVNPQIDILNTTLMTPGVFTGKND